MTVNDTGIYADAGSSDSLGYRGKFGVLVPSTNTVVQPEFDAMRPAGVTNHTSRIVIPDDPVRDDNDFALLMTRIQAALAQAVDAVTSCRPDRLILGMSAESFWDGAGGADTLQRQLEQQSGVPVTLAAGACREALACYGNPRRLAIITPYMPLGDTRVRAFFTELGFDVITLKGLRCPSPTQIAHVSEQTLSRVIREIDSPDIQAIIQVGTNLAMARLAATAETWLGKPVIAVNTATYWWALRQHGITDRIAGFGSLLAHH
jgi:maleate isomerase